MSGASGGFSSIGAGITSIAGAVGDIFTAQGEFAAAKEFGTASQLASQNATESKYAGALQKVQLARQVSQVQGTATANAAAGNLKIAGSAAAIIRSNATQGALAQQLVGEQTQINVNGYMEQQAADVAEQEQANAAGKAAEAAAAGGILGGAVDIIGGIVGIAGSAAAA